MFAKAPSSFPNGIIDVFNQFKVFDLNIVQVKRQGETLCEIENSISKKVLKINGNLSASNFIEIPNPNYGQKSLNFTGKYYYIIFKAFDDKKFIVELVYLINNYTVRFNLKFPLSEIKLNKANIFSVDIPIKISNNNWNILKFDPIEFLQANFNKEATSLGTLSHENLAFKSVTFYSTIYVRGIYISNYVYDKKSIPKEMSFKTDQNNPYFNVNFIELTNSQLTAEQIERNDQSISISKSDILENFDTKINDIDKKAKQYREENIAKILSNKVKDKSKDKSMTREEDKSLDEKRAILSDYDLKELPNELLNRKMESINREVLDKREVIKSIFKKTDEKKQQLLPDPILNLKYILGFSGKTCNLIKFSKNEGKKYVFFPSGNIMINFDYTELKQKFFFGHSKPITQYIFSSDDQYLFTAQEGKNAMIRVWKIEHARCIKILTTPYDRINSMSISKDGKLLTTIGKEGQLKELLLIWDISSVDEIKIVIRQVSHFNINCIKFSPYDQGLLLSCGKENIKFWRIKNDHLGGKAVVLNQYARNTNFICLDFDNPFLGDNAQGKAYVGSNTGCIFQISCTTQELEKIFQLHDSSILAIAVNDAFCVTGSSDGLIRVWPIDFQEFLIEAKHDSGVCAIDIAFDGLDVVCGSLSGSIGILNIQTKIYKAILRSPPGKISHMSVHPGLRYVFTIEDEKTIRIWDIDNKSEAFLYTSNKDAPISIDAPQSNIFACGFNSGLLKIFDIDNSSILYECKTFNLPIKKLKFTVDSSYLIVMNSQGHFSIHDAKNSFIQIKVVKIDQPATNVDLSMNNEGDYFASIGPESNCAIVWNSKTFGIKNRVPISNHFIYKLNLINKNILCIILENCSVSFYSLATFEGNLLKEFHNVHIEKVNQFISTNNYKFMISGGEEGMIKIWDFKMLYKNYTSIQQFIGHSSGIKAIACLDQKSLLITVSENDGIFFWNFLGDLTFCDSEILKEIEKFGEKSFILTDKSKKNSQNKSSSVKPISHLEKSYKLEHNDAIERRLNIKKEKREIEKQTLMMLPIDKEVENMEIIDKVQALSTGKKNNIKDNSSIDFLEKKLLFYPNYIPCKIEKYTIPKISTDKMIKKYFLGYNSKSLNNLIYVKERNFFAFSANNKVIIEFLEETRQHTILEDHQDEISCLALSPDKNFLVSGAGIVNKDENATICVWDLSTFTLKKRLNFHYKAIQQIKFSFDGKYMISLGSKEEKSICIWNFSNFSVNDSKSLKFNVIDCVCEKQFDKFFYFVTISLEVLSFWRMDTSYKLEGFHIKYEDLCKERELNEYFTCVELTPYFDKIKTSFVLIGTSSGAILVVDKEKKILIRKFFLFQNPIIKIFFTEERLILTGDSPILLSWIIPYKKFNSEYVFDFLEKDKSSIMFLEDNICSAFFTATGNEGLVATSNNVIMYLNLTENLNLKIIQSHQNCDINSLEVDLNDRYLFSSGDDGTVRAWTQDSFDMKNQCFYLNEKCQFSALNTKDNVIISNFNNIFLRMFSMNDNKFKNLGKVNIPENEISCFGMIFNNQGIILSTLQDRIYILDIQNWEVLNILFTEIDTTQFNLPKNQFYKSIDTKSINPNKSLALFSFSDGTIVLLNVEKDNARITSSVIDKFNMFEYHIKKSDDVHIAELYKNLTKIRTNYISQAKFSRKYDNIIFGIHECLQFLYIRDFKTNEIFRRIPLNYFPTCLSINEGEKYIAIGTKEGLILFVTKIENTLNSGFNLDIFQGHFDYVKALNFNKKSNLLFSSSYSEIIVWEIL